MKLNKQALRASIRERKKAMSGADLISKSQQLCRMVLNSDAYKNAGTIYGYLPFQQEVQILPLLRQAISDGKQVALPKCYGKEMRFIMTRDFSRVRYSSFGVPEPVADIPVADDKTALVIVPGLAFDARGHRIGYGGGYYDRFLSQEQTHPTIALCFDFQMVSCLEPEPHDIPVDTVLYI